MDFSSRRSNRGRRLPRTGSRLGERDAYKRANQKDDQFGKTRISSVAAQCGNELGFWTHVQDMLSGGDR